MSWTVPRDWEGETAFILGGGPSVAGQDLGLLNGHRVIAINRSFETYPEADMVVFYDPTFWNHFREQLKSFKGQIVTCHPNISGPNLLRLKRKTPPGLAEDPRFATVQRTSFSMAINIAAHRGVSTIILLGADGKVDGAMTHHHGSYPWWKPKKERFGMHRAELASLVKPLERREIRVINASPGSVWDMWPVMSLKDAVCSLN